MSTPKHTPGPWFTDNRDIYSSDGRHVVAMVTQDVVLRDADHLATANAHLIAAAPELLEHLTLLVRWAEDQGEECQFAKAAIAKARGES